MRKNKSVKGSSAFSKGDACQKKTLMFDWFYKKPLNLMLPDDNSEYRTFWGSMFTIVTIIILVLFAGYKMSSLFSRSEYKI